LPTAHPGGDARDQASKPVLPSFRAFVAANPRPACNRFNRRTPLPSRDYWRLGAIFGALFIAVMLIVAVPWLALMR